MTYGIKALIKTVLADGTREAFAIIPVCVYYFENIQLQ